jgi:hypothetical protein
LGKFGDIPVSNYTGVPSVEIPIYNVITGELSLPISLNYHAGGIRVDEIASNAGLGWALNCGGMISRTVRGIPDDSQYGYLNNGIDILSVPSLSLTEKYNLYQKIQSNLTDLEPDVYNYSFFGKSGKFLIDRITRKGYLVNNNEKISIQWNSDGTWLITDGTGLKYYFGNVAEQSIVNQQGRTINASVNYPSSWLLVKAEDLKGNLIQLTYKDYSSIYCLANQETKTFLYYVDGVPEYGCNPFNAQTKSWDEYEILGKKLSTITWKSGVVNFAYASTARLDINSTDNSIASITVTDNSFAQNQIKKFNFFHSYFNVLPTQNQSFCAGSSNGKLRLDKIQQIGNDNIQAMPAYEFTYNDFIPILNSTSQDHWGFNNGQLNGTSLVPKMSVLNPYQTVVAIDGAIRTPDLPSCLAGTLAKIKYPTGGVTEFTYELHDAYMPNFSFEEALDLPFIQYGKVSKSDMVSIPYKKVAFVVNGPYNAITQQKGFFVNILIVLNGTCDPSIRNGGCGGSTYIQPVAGTQGSSWQFGNIGNLNGTIIKQVFLKNGNYELILEGDNSIAGLNILSSTVIGPDATMIDSMGNYNKPIGGLRIKKISSSSSSTETKQIINYKYKKEFYPANSSGVLVSDPGYGYITSVTGIPSNGVTNTCYLFNRTSSSKVPMGTTQGSHIGYSFVEVTKGQEGVSPNIGKTTFAYTTAKDFPDLYSPVFPFPPPTSLDMQRGLLLETKTYKFENDNYSIVSYSKNNYTNPDSRYNKNIPGVIIASQGVNAIGQVITTKAFEDKSNWVWLNEEINTQYSLGGQIQTSVKYFYDNIEHLQPTRIEKLHSDGYKEITYIKYPADFLDTEADQVTKDMKGSKHIYNLPIQKTVSKTSLSIEKVVQSQIIKYGTNVNAVIPIENIQLETSSILNINDPVSFPKYLPINGYDINKFKRSGIYSYDANSNLITQQKENDVKEVYIWGYNKTLPVAQIINANNNEILFNGFEENLGWDASLTAYDISFKHSGTSSGRIDKVTTGELYTLGSTWLNINLNSATKFKYSGWVYSNGPSADLYLFMKRAGESGYYSYIDVTSTSTIGKWEFIEKEFTVPVDVTQLNIRLDNNGGGNVWFDDLRLFPSVAQMKTYTFAPLIGMTSQCDANNRFTFYEYDAFNRLSIIRDQDNNIIKKICYNYAGIAENCTIPSFTNDLQQNIYTSTVTCAAGTIPASYTYTVPAGSYTSYVDKLTANQLAIAAMNTNGQAAANALPCLAGLSGWNQTSQPWNITVTNSSGTFNTTYSFYPGSSATLFTNLPVGTYNLNLTPLYPGSVTSPVQLILNGTTYSGTSFSLTSVNINTATTVSLKLPAVPCSFTMSSGYSTPTNSISSNGTTVSFYMVFYPSITMNLGSSYLVATINGSCRPSVIRTITTTVAGRNWNITIYPTGEMYWQIGYGSTALSPYSSVGTSTLTYNL